MKVIKITPKFSDSRGEITDIVENIPFDAATIISCRPGAIRGNHFHKETVQYLYVLSGHILYRTKLPDDTLIDSELKPGDLILTEKLESHAMQAKEESSFLVLTRGPRQGGKYEDDTFRLETPLIYQS